MEEKQGQQLALKSHESAFSLDHPQDERLFFEKMEQDTSFLWDQSAPGNLEAFARPDPESFCHQLPTDYHQQLSEAKFSQHQYLHTDRS